MPDLESLFLEETQAPKEALSLGEIQEDQEEASEPASGKPAANMPLGTKVAALVTGAVGAGLLGWGLKKLLFG